MSQALETDDTLRETSLRENPGLVVVFTRSRPVTIALPLRDTTLELGRGHPLLSSLGDPSMSRRHISVAFDGRFFVTELASRNGTAVDGMPLQPGERLAADRVIRIGQTLIAPVRDITPLLCRGVRVVDGRVAGSTSEEAFDAISRAARRGRTVHIIGESGTGKEALARAFHAAGPAAGGPFEVVRCAALPADAVDRMLFGAGEGTVGYLQAASGGTLVLEDVDELPSATQAKLVHVLERGVVLPLGARRPERVDLRICFVTQRDPRDQVEAARLREDLYFRIASPRVMLPPLRERREEIAHLLEMEVRRTAPDLPLHVSLVEACLLRSWPGNVRELIAEAHNAAVAALAAGALAVRANHLDPMAGEAFRTSSIPPAESAEIATCRPASSSAIWTRSQEDLTEEAILVRRDPEMRSPPRVDPPEDPATAIRPTGDARARGDEDAARGRAPAATLVRFTRDDDAWIVEHAGAALRMKDSDGLRYLAYLVERPNREVYVGELLEEARGARARRRQTPVGMEAVSDLAVRADLGDAGPMLDAQAKAAYARRIEDLKGNIEEAEAHNDRARAGRARVELEALQHELARAVGLGGRGRRVSSASERARVNATLRIRKAIAGITERSGALGHHLSTCVKTGTFCAYVPGPAEK